MLKLGCHVGMSGKEMFLGSVKEAISYGANTFMVYTGAPQNTRRKPISELRIEEGLALAKEHEILEFIIMMKNKKKEYCYLHLRNFLMKKQNKDYQKRNI